MRIGSCRTRRWGELGHASECCRNLRMWARFLPFPVSVLALTDLLIMDSIRLQQCSRLWPLAYDHEFHTIHAPFPDLYQYTQHVKCQSFPVVGFMLTFIPFQLRLFKPWRCQYSIPINKHIYWSTLVGRFHGELSKIPSWKQTSEQSSKTVILKWTSRCWPRLQMLIAFMKKHF